ncbi:BA75_00728T0 [Komagataella pastoris]|uniref:BA75_00728T0 n=1 Tax=Komagataella pastoris TaxID=4922 RepID=A0A1B2J5W3_PICPA|nr:BA75_00728T0 [Komagataella pastoris]
MGDVNDLPSLNKALEVDLDSDPISISDQSIDIESPSTNNNKRSSPIIMGDPEVCFRNRFEFNYSEPVRYHVYHSSSRSFNLEEELNDCRPKHLSIAEQAAFQDGSSGESSKRPFLDVVPFDVYASPHFQGKRSIWKKLRKLLRKKENPKIHVLNQYKFPMITADYDESASKTVTFDPDVIVRETWSTKNYTRVDPMLREKLADIINSPEQIEQIQNELNELKNEMDIHIQSRYNTQYFDKESRLI